MTTTLTNSYFDPEKLITITVEGGCVVEVSGLPDGYLYEINDQDIQDQDSDA